MKIAAITFVEDDDVFLPVWERYYGAHTDMLHRVTWDRPFSPLPIANFITKVAAELLTRYDAVVYADLDEYIVPDPDKYKNLRDYIERMTGDVAYTTGYDVLPSGSPLDLSKPMLAQREWMSFSSFYCKPLIIKYPVPWGPGLHHYTGRIEESKADPDLMLFHMNLADIDIARARISKRRNITDEELMDKLSRKNMVGIPQRYLTTV